VASGTLIWLAGRRADAELIAHTTNRASALRLGDRRDCAGHRRHTSIAFCCLRVGADCCHAVNLRAHRHLTVTAASPLHTATPCLVELDISASIQVGTFAGRGPPRRPALPWQLDLKSRRCAALRVKLELALAGHHELQPIIVPSPVERPRRWRARKDRPRVIRPARGSATARER
jgi:hypothetical protein